jgi:hypothetical protein
MEIKIKIEDTNKDRILNAFCKARGYEEITYTTNAEGVSEETENPMSKTEFVKQAIISFIFNTVDATEEEEEFKTAMQKTKIDRTPLQRSLIS